ncbi:MAG: hypothetical protein KME60_27220 [Cyanomargarita calcarea GSE-NOS-MK-12-04C]|uniref:Uncharacterized protein n=1 Tax=Cyanomargarita calcarea GSE-NOS-MK-12-04C TaxID=2839659 RepID=A0A951QS16_9CYAN|nr:hypothetical protein [Cyanomargarita calcarea GSE-NOS-MK-12-04C]
MIIIKLFNRYNTDILPLYLYSFGGDREGNYVIIPTNGDAYGEQSYHKITLPLESYYSHL